MSALSVHSMPSKIHAGNIPTLPQTKRCTICNAKFTRTTHLNRHLRSHTNERLYHCDICESQFTRSDLLARHKRTCGDPNANRSRRKSCQSCAASKIKCDLQLPCSKCTARGRKCEYINDPRITRDKKAAALAAAAASSSRRGSIASSASDASETTSDEASSCASPPPNCASVFPSFGVYKHHHHHNRHELADNAQQQQQQQQLQQQYSHLALPSSGPRDYYHQAPDAAAALFDDLYNPTHVSPTLPADLSPLPHGATPLSTYTFPDQLHPHCTYTTGDPVIVAGGASPLHHGASVPEVYLPDVYQTMHYGAGGLSPISISTNLAVYGLYGKAPSTPYVMTPDSTFSSPSTTYGLSAWDSPQELCNTPNVMISPSSSHMWPYA